MPRPPLEVDGSRRRSPLSRVDQRRIGDRAREHAAVIEGRRGAEQARGADASERRLEADAPAERRGNADASARVAAGGRGGQASRDGCRRSAARSAGHARAIPGLRVVPKNGLIVVTPPPSSCVLLLPRRTVPAAASRATSVASCEGTCGSNSREPAVVRMPGSFEEVLVRDRHARDPARAFSLCAAGGPPAARPRRPVRGDGDIRGQRGVQAFDPPQVRFGDVGDRYRFRGRS